MDTDPGKLIDPAKARTFVTRLSALVGKVTCRIDLGKSIGEAITGIGRSWQLNDTQRQFLCELGETKKGKAFIEEKVSDMNRAAFHRSAFALNAFFQLAFVDLGAPLQLSLPQLKVALVLANLALVFVAHSSRRRDFRRLLAGPDTLPPKRRLWGLRSNPRYNKAIKKHSRPYARSAWKEKALYRTGYFLNAASLFLGSQFIFPARDLIFPLSFIVDKITGISTTLVMIFDLWRGVKAGDDARKASERQVSVYRDLDV